MFGFAISHIVPGRTVRSYRPTAAGREGMCAVGCRQSGRNGYFMAGYGMNILKTAWKVILSPFLLCVFLAARLIQFFLKICGAVVTFVCILAAVVLTIGAVAEIILQVQGRGPGIGAVVVCVIIAAGLAYIPAAGVGAVMVVLEGLCGWILRMYRPALKKVHISMKKPDYQWADYEWDNYKVPGTLIGNNHGERKIHYFKGAHTREELKKRYIALLRIYQPDNEFGEDEITRSIMDEFDYLNKILPSSEENSDI